MSHQPLSEPPLLVLTRADVRECLRSIDVVQVVEDALMDHFRGRCAVPPEAYMPWTNSRLGDCRALAMPGSINSERGLVLGLKVINAAVTNPDQGIPRAGGFTTLFDPETSRPRVLAEGALISALRTGAYTIASMRHLGPPEPRVVCILGCGYLAQVHAELLRRYMPTTHHVRLFDVRGHASMELARHCRSSGWPCVTTHETPEEALEGADIVITLTTSSQPYIARSWLAPSAFVAHVSLDDLCAEVFTEACAVYVDDVDLVIDNPRRILGRLLRDAPPETVDDESASVRLVGTLGDVISGKVTADPDESGLVISNPFGMATLDLAILQQVEQIEPSRV